MKLKPELKALREMIEESAGWKHIRADSNLCLKNSGGLLFQCQCASRRDGPTIWAVCFSMKPKKDDPRLRAFVLAAMLYNVWPQKCTDLFGSDRTRNNGSLPQKLWINNADKKLFRAVEKLLEDRTLKVNPAVGVLADELHRKLSELATPLDLWMADVQGPLIMAVKRGASRDDLIRMVDEAIAESVHSS